MHTAKSSLLAALFLGAVSAPCPAVQVFQPPLAGPFRYGSIVVVKVDEIVRTFGGPPGSGFEGAEVRARVTKVLRDKRNLEFAPGEFRATIQPHMPTVGISGNPAWTTHILQAGQEYIVFSDSTEGISTIFERPYALELLTGEVDAVGDIELALNSEELSVFEQAERVALSLNDSKKHSRFLTQYIAVLLAAGPDTDTQHLERETEAAETHAFSDKVRPDLLGYLDHMFRYQAFSRSTPPQGNLVSALANLTVRYFVGSPKTTDAGATRFQIEILSNIITDLLRTDRGRTALRIAASSPETVVRIKAKAAQCASDSHLTPQLQANARQLLAFFGGPAER